MLILEGKQASMSDKLNQAKQLAKDGKVGWLCPDGSFFEASETGGEVAGLNLGRHESAAMRLLEADYKHLWPELNQRRLKLGCRTWPETTRYNLIKSFMVEQGFIRVAEDILSISDYD